MSNLTLPLGFDPTAFVQNQKAIAQKTVFIACGVIIGCLGALTIMLGAWTLEVALTYTVIEANFGPEFPDEPVPLKVYILAFASICAIIAFHALMLGDREHPVAIWLQRIARVSLIVFFIGMALLFLSTDMSTPPTDLSDAELFGEGAANESWLWALIEPITSMTSALALGGLVFINLALSDAILSWVSEKLPKSIDDLRDAKATIETASEIEVLDTIYGDLNRQEEALRKIDEDALALEVAGHVSDVAQPTIQGLAETVHENRLIPPSNSTMLGKTAKAKLTPDINAIDAFLADWEAFSDDLPRVLRTLT